MTAYLTYTLTNTVVTDEVLFTPGGDIYRWAHQVQREFVTEARLRAPIDKRANKTAVWIGYPVGSLARSISGEVRHPSLRIFNTQIVVDVPYALAVVRGTSRITSRSARVPRGESGAGQFAPLGDGGGMILPPNFGIGTLRRRSVSGQRANPFLAETFRTVGARHSSLRGFSMTL